MVQIEMPFYPGFFILFGGPNRNLFGFLSIWYRSTGFPSPKSQIDCITYLRNPIWYWYLETVASGLISILFQLVSRKRPGRFHPSVRPDCPILRAPLIYRAMPVFCLISLCHIKCRRVVSSSVLRVSLVLRNLD